MTREGQTVLGDVIDIPYSIENLLEAYENLPIATKSQIDPSNIRPTHYYVRFYPKSIAELDTLRNIKPYVFLSETPLDRKIEIGGTSYHDPAIAEDLPTYQYTVVPVDRWAVLSETVPVESEVLIKAYIPDYDEAYTTKSEEVYGIPSKAYEALLKEAYRITGNEYDVIPETKASWTPVGRVSAYDDKTSSYLPVPGVRVRGTHLLKVKEALTNANGVYVLPSFNNSVTYKIIWESEVWDIRDGLIGQATFDGPTQSNGWSPNIGTIHEKTVRYAATQRAAYKYFYQDIDGLLRPIFSTKLKICQRDNYSSSPSVFTNDYAMGWHIESWIYDLSGNLRTIHDMFYHIAHELGHASHYSNNTDDFNSYAKAIKESWAIFSGLTVYKKEYGEYHNTYYHHYEDNWPNVTNVRYNPLFLDLFDDYNQSLTSAYLVIPNDEVSGYSCSSLASILNNSAYTLSALKQKVKDNAPLGVSVSDINTLFSVYESNWINDYD